MKPMISVIRLFSTMCPCIHQLGWVQLQRLAVCLIVRGYLMHFGFYFNV